MNWHCHKILYEFSSIDPFLSEFPWSLHEAEVVVECRIACCFSQPSRNSKNCSETTCKDVAVTNSQDAPNGNTLRIQYFRACFCHQVMPQSNQNIAKTLISNFKKLIHESPEFQFDSWSRRGIVRHQKSSQLSLDAANFTSIVIVSTRTNAQTQKISFQLSGNSIIHHKNCKRFVSFLGHRKL